MGDAKIISEKMSRKYSRPTNQYSEEHASRLTQAIGLKPGARNVPLNLETRRSATASLSRKGVLSIIDDNYHYRLTPQGEITATNTYSGLNSVDIGLDSFGRISAEILEAAPKDQPLN